MQERLRPLHSAMPEEKEKKGESCHHLCYVLSLPSPSTGQGASIPIVSVTLNRSITFGWLSSFQKGIIWGFCGELVHRTGNFSPASAQWRSGFPLTLCRCAVLWRTAGTRFWKSRLRRSPLIVGWKMSVGPVFFVARSRNAVAHLANVKSQNAPSERWERDIREKMMVDNGIVWAQGNLGFLADGLLATHRHRSDPILLRSRGLVLFFQLFLAKNRLERGHLTET